MEPEVAIALLFGVVFIAAMKYGWELTALFFGISLLIYGCEKLGV